MRTLRLIAAACLLWSGFCGSGIAAPRIDSGMIVTAEGLSLYVFDNDPSGTGKSVCTGTCEGLHPPYLATATETASDPWSLVVREDGTKQWAYKGRPLYRFYADERKGDIGGDGINRNTWHVARP